MQGKAGVTDEQKVWELLVVGWEQSARLEEMGVRALYKAAVKVKLVAARVKQVLRTLEEEGSVMVRDDAVHRLAEQR